MKKFASLLLALVMIMSCFTAMAEETKYTITISNAPKDSIYEAYQIFAGDLSGQSDSDTVDGTNAVLSNITWGNGVDGAALLTELKTVETFAACTDAVDVAEKLHESKDDSTVVKTFAAIVAKHLTTVAATSGAYNADNNTYTISGLGAGYYLVKDQDGSVTGNESYTRFIIEVVENSTVATKSAVPSSEKKVKDTNDSTSTTSDWQDSADYDIGDDVPFQLSGTVASNYADYKVYKFTFHDTLSNGLTFNKDSVKVAVNGVEITTGYEVVTEGLTDGCTFEVRFADLKQINSVNAGSKITVEYTAKLNANADLGNLGNDNAMHLEYSNNPNDEDGGETGKTPEDTVVVFTYTVIVNKVDENKAPLTGAGFTLYKQNGTNANNEAIWVAIGEEITGEALTKFEWKGLDDGNYKLVETTTPAGYNTVEDILFTITAEHEVVATKATLTSLEGGELFSEDLTLGSLTTDVENVSGSTLPETGGMGTTLLYVGGGILVLAAIVLLIAKRRVNAD